jgi:hypothetical protein
MCKCGCDERVSLAQQVNRLEFVRRLVNPKDLLRNRVILRDTEAPMPQPVADMGGDDWLKERLGRLGL